MRTICEFNAQGLANTAWAFAVLVFVDCPLLKAIAAESRAKLKLFSPHNLANTVWAFSKLSM
eukprot:CAMPEP_0115051436 /NCGR_PEP_ID=MMETSP0227-20121206/2344_1 /TAXON_ID=89957 /ORGANISM="Polarella glacialis, Strain CCMP 1383" /LENGTH=61 /DNA_ID=CAMNT_0002435413 /DNA_START=211 /DNA_END=396 /DNA_ORIENTATION=+